MGLLDLVKAIDIFGHEFKFNFLGNDSVKTLGGAIISLLFFLSALAVTANSLRKLFDKSTPLISQQTTQMEFSERIYLGRHHLWAPVFVLEENTAQVGADQVLQIYHTPLQRLHFSLDWYSMGFRGNNNYKVLESVPGMMCKDLKARPGALYYPDLIEMSEETRKSIDEHGVCFDVPENKWYMETTDKAMKAFKTTVKYCWDRADCIQDDNFLFRSRLFQVTPQPSVDLYNYEKPVKYAYDTASDLVADFSTLNNQNLEFVFGINELQKVSDQHILFDRTEEVGEFEYFKIQPDVKPRSIPLSDETHMKCPGDTEWVPYSSTTFDSSTCVSQKGTYCDKELNEKNLCEVLVSSNSFINLRIETPKKTVIVRTYAGISSVLGEIGGLVSLLLSIFGFVNGIITQFFFRSRVLNIFFPIFQSKKITQHSNLKEIKKRAGEFINERLDIHRLLHDLACVQILLDLVFDQNMRDLALISSLRQFMEKSNQENQKASSPNGLAKQKKPIQPKNKVSTGKESEALHKKPDLIEMQFESFAAINKRAIKDETTGERAESPTTEFKRLADQRISSDFNELVMKELFKPLENQLAMLGGIELGGFGTNLEEERSAIRKKSSDSSSENPDRGIRGEKLAFTSKNEKQLEAVRREPLFDPIPDEAPKDPLLVKGQLPPLDF